MPVSRERVLEIRNEIAERHGIWLFNRACHSLLPHHSYVEWYVGENMLKLSDEAVRRALAVWSDAISTELR
jgi:hypothetical protein